MGRRPKIIEQMLHENSTPSVVEESVNNKERESNLPFYLETQDEIPLVEEVETVTDYATMIEDSVFLGSMPFDTICRGIKTQFEDYINMVDRTNYVDVFYEEFNVSYMEAIADEGNDHQAEVFEALKNMKSRFETMMFELFEGRLTLSINTVDDASTEEDELEFVIRKLYDFFIINARENFKQTIASNILEKISGSTNLDDADYFAMIDHELQDWDPLVRAVQPDEFIKMLHQDEVMELFDDGDVTGNFLRKYSAKLYQNEEFKIEIVSYITMLEGLKEDMSNG